MTTQFFMELLGTLILVLFGGGVCTYVALNKGKEQNSGWIVIATAWGPVACMGMLAASSYTGAHLDPAISAGLATTSMFPWSSALIYTAGQIIGGVLGAVLVWVFCKDHYDAADDDATKFGTFCTAPAIRNYKLDFLCEVIAVSILVFIIASFSSKGNCCDPKDFRFGLATLGPIPATLLVIALEMSLDGPTGYTVNPARDLSLRIVHALRMKGDNDWAYAWVPVLGPIIGGIIVGLCGATPYQL